MLAPDALYADYGGRADFFLALPLYARSCGTDQLRRARSYRNGNQPTTTNVATIREGKDSGSDPPGV
jgi:hypothetical protein